MNFIEFLAQYVNERQGKYNTTQKADEIREKVLSGKSVEVKRPTSYRSYKKGTDGTYSSGTYSIGKYKPGSRTAALASTAIGDVKYDPTTKICKVQYVGGGKWYDFKMEPDEFMKFIDSPSKGRYVQYVMKVQNRV